MTLGEIRERFKNGAIDKQAYIDQMHKVHEALFAYADYSEIDFVFLTC